jgi:hypothetical protein
METFGISSYTFWASYLVCNLVAVLLVWGSKKQPGLTKAVFFLIFVAAAAINAYTAIDAPWAYQDYADTAIPLYKKFILGAFHAIITPMVLIIAFAQLLIAISMLLKGKPLVAGCWAGMVFCMSIAPLGLYAAFPCTLLLAAALFRLQRHENNHLSSKKPSKLARITAYALK